LGTGFHPFGIHTAGECFICRSVAKSSFLRHEVFLWGGWLGDTLHWRLSCFSSHCRRLGYESQCGESLIRLSSHCRSMRYKSQCG